MELIKKEYSFPSVTGLADIYVRCRMPKDGEIKAVFQMVHGMAEHGERYEEFAEKMCEAGYAFVINDHIGHGKSVKSKDDYGYFGNDINAEGNGFVDDAHTLTLMLKKEFNKPVILMGHSMGSFVVRKYVSKYADDIAGVIVCGTSGSNPGAKAGIFLADTVIKLKGEKYRSKLIDKIAFGSYNKKFEGRTAFDWLSKNQPNIDRYIGDDGCGFLFTASGFKNMFQLLDSVSGAEWYKAVPKDLNILLIAGAEDPVGNYSKGVIEVYNKLKDSNHKNADYKIYANDRHEILNELDRETVFADIIEWCDKLIG